MAGITRWKSINEKIEWAGKNPYMVGLFGGLGTISAMGSVANPLIPFGVVLAGILFYPEYKFFIAPTDEQRKEALSDTKIPQIAIDRIVKVLDHQEIGRGKFPEDAKKLDKLAYNTLLQNNLEWCEKDAVNCEKYNKIIKKMYGKV